MNENWVDGMLRDRYEQERRRRNEMLRERLQRARTFGEMLKELGALKGFNVEERARALPQEGI